jgi:hypothetical protein
MSGEKASEAGTLDPAVHHPRHYVQGGIEAIDAIEAAITGLAGTEAFLTGQVLRYLWRWKFKGGLQDLEKAAWYLARLTKHVHAQGTERGGH